jgi:sugar phosphate isomerase/epimerase
MEFTRRDLGKIALASVPLARALSAKTIDSKFGGVQIGAITYSFNRIASPDPEAIIKAYVEIGLGECELMSNHCEALAGAPAMPAFGRGGGGAARGAGGGGRAPLTPEQQAERQAAMEKLAKWRTSTGASTWKAVTKKFNDAGVDVALLCYNMQDAMKDEDIEYGFSMAKGLGVKGITTSTTLTMAKRIAPVADKHKLLVGYHGHDATNDANQTATLESYATLMEYGKYNGINLDIGHFTAAGYDAVAFIKEHHDRITKRTMAPTWPFGAPATPPSRM